MRKLEDYWRFAGPETLENIRNTAKPLAGKKILMLNSTNRMGGVAEILKSLIPLFNSLGIDVDWRLAPRRKEFFRVTKKIHNALQGWDVELSNKEKNLYLKTNKVLASRIDFSVYDLVVIHDPQPLAVINFLKPRQPWLFRLHLDITSPNQPVWEFLKTSIEQYSGMFVSHEDFIKNDLAIRQRVLVPAIDPLVKKNQNLSEKTIRSVFNSAGINQDKPIISQISRFDMWKDHIGVIKVFERVRESFDCQLVLEGDFAPDDPEAQKIYEQVAARASTSRFGKDIRILSKHNAVSTNALQRASKVVVQKSIREGFGLTISEALFKMTPVVATPIGGIKSQVIDSVNGYLNDPQDIDGTASDILKILKDDDLRRRLGEAGREHVKKHFLIPRLLQDWLNIMHENT